MDRELELELLDELISLDQEKLAYLDEDIALSPVEHYCDPDHFAQEHDRVFRSYPQIAAHCSELPEPGSFLRRDLAGLPAFLTRDRDGQVHAFLNVCRHRGARLVEDEKGCKHSFSCPYHAWTWSNTGDLRGVPHQKQGFPDLDKSKYGLIRLPCSEISGWIWVVPNPKSSFDIAAFVAPAAADFAWLDGGNLRMGPSNQITCAANWKILLEGGIEAYHFRVAHKDTIGPFFPDNLSSYRMMGHHMRSVLPRVTIGDLHSRPRDSWNIRDEANVLYTFFPTSQFLVQQDHLIWIRTEPLAADQTRLTLTTMVPADAPTDLDAHWQKNHQITMHTLSEDFDIGEAIQSGLASGANDALTFGRYEGALTQFANMMAQAVSDPAA
ncbi:MAG: Rieske 2Fe-2S domain-containing protein [Rhodobacteraceae bacterium]|nr:Rieske 2Fe-2S domain-containing protein [Paracoccaceae bacterium]